MLLKATELLAAANELPVAVRFAIDAEEEVGGHSVVDWVGEDTGPADVGLVLDGGYATETLPSFCTALRGICYFHLTVRTGERDLHSGMVGGAALAATHVLIEVLQAVLPGPDGRLPEPLRAGIVAPTDEEVAGWAALPHGRDELAGAGRAPVGRARRGRVHGADDRGAVGHRERDRGRLAPAPEDGAPGRGAGERLDPPRAGAVDGRDRAGLRAPPARRDAAGRDPRRRALVDRRARLRRSRVARRAGRPGGVRAGARHRVRCSSAPAARSPSSRRWPSGASPRSSRGSRGRARSSTRRTRTSPRRPSATGWRRPSSCSGGSGRLAETRYASPLAEELAEDVLERFLRYVVIDTQSDPTSTSYPSTEKQLDLSRLLVDELRALGLEDVELTEHGYVFATLPGTVAGAPTVGLIAHVDTAPGVSGTGVRPLVHRGWDGRAAPAAGRPRPGARPRRHAGARGAGRPRPRDERRDDAARRGRQGGRRDHRHRGRAPPARRRAARDRCGSPSRSTRRSGGAPTTSTSTPSAPTSPTRSTARASARSRPRRSPPTSSCSRSRASACIPGPARGASSTRSS